MGFSRLTTLTWILAVVGAALPWGIFSEAQAVAQADATQSDLIEVIYQGPEGRRVLKSWTRASLKAWSQPLGKWLTTESWEGVSLFALLEKIFEEMNTDERTQTDWLALSSGPAGGGTRASFPRFLLHRYNVALGWAEGSTLGFRHLAASAKQHWHLMMPLTSQPKILKEALPVEALHGAPVRSILLTRLEAIVAQDLLLKDRSNPVALRGEKRFLQTCVACHQAQADFRGASTVLKPLPERHPAISSWSRLDWVGFEAYRAALGQ